jgi:hypothetical protein
MTSEVAPAASGRLSVANALSTGAGYLIHHPSAVDRLTSLTSALHNASATTLGGVKVALETIVIVVVFVIPLIVVFAVFIWGARKDGEADRAVQRRLGIRRRTRLGR